MDETGKFIVKQCSEIEVLREASLGAPNSSAWPSNRWKHLFRNPWIVWWLFLCHEMQKPMGDKPNLNDACRAIMFMVVLFSPWWLKDNKTPNDPDQRPAK